MAALAAVPGAHAVTGGPAPPELVGFYTTTLTRADARKLYRGTRGSWDLVIVNSTPRQVGHGPSGEGRGTDVFGVRGNRLYLACPFVGTKGEDVFTWKRTGRTLTLRFVRGVCTGVRTRDRRIILTAHPWTRMRARP